MLRITGPAVMTLYWKPARPPTPVHAMFAGRFGPTTSIPECGKPRPTSGKYSFESVLIIVFKLQEHFHGLTNPEEYTLLVSCFDRSRPLHSPKSRRALVRVLQHPCARFARLQSVDLNCMILRKFRLNPNSDRSDHSIRRVRDPDNPHVRPNTNRRRVGRDVPGTRFAGSCVFWILAKVVAKQCPERP